MQRILRVLILVLLVAAFATSAVAQTAATINGTVTDESGNVFPGAEITATNVASGFTHSATAGADGRFTLAGLAPATYRIDVTAPSYKGSSKQVQVLVGQTLDLNFRLTPDLVLMENITVVGDTTPVLIDTRTTEVATNITQQQIENLPLNNRNFLAFAGLAPGVSFTKDTDGVGQSFSSGAQDAKQVNVFIDGVSFKNDIIKGGAFMQDSSRGNPFPQSAVQEYQVLTQNYKAEYEKATAAVISAVTKSGTNAYKGEAFYLYQDEGMVAQDDFAKKRGDKKSPYERNQYGLSFGGPIIRDRLHFFVTGEKNDRDVVSSVFVGAQWAQAPENVKAALSQYDTGTIVAPFKSTLFFGKLSFQPSNNQTAELSLHTRDEDEIRGFGNQRVQEGGSNIVIGTDAATLRHQFVFGANAINEANLSYQKMSWADTATDLSKVHQNFVNLLDVGGKDFIQDLDQTRFGLRDDVSFYLNWRGAHTVKVGGSASSVKYDLTKSAFLNPYFEYRDVEGWQYPFKAVVGFGDPSLDFDNQQYGLYVQDDWRINKLTLNAGVRWDYETNMLNNDWVTPAAIANGLRTACRHYDTAVGGKNDWCIKDLFNVEDYISTGDNRESPTDLFQPRVGLSYDVRGNGATVVFGGWGLYYDRIALNDIYDEAYRNQWRQYQICFTADGTPNTACGPTAVKWDNKYLDPDQLRTLVQSGQTGGPEVYLLNNNTDVPQSTQWTVGLRQQLGSWLGSLTYANSRSKNGLVWSFGTEPPGTKFDDRWGNWISIPGYGFVLRSFDTRRRKYDGVYLTLDHPRTAGSRWGANIAYTWSKGLQNASRDDGVAFAFDFLPDNMPLFPANGDERHRLVVSGSVGLPFGFDVSSIISLASPTAISYAEALTGPYHYYPNGTRPETQSFLGIDEFGYRSVDARLQWNAPRFSNVQVSLIGEAFNLFNYDNYSSFTDWAGGLNSPNPDFLKPTAEFNTRRYQVGTRISF